MRKKSVRFFLKAEDLRGLLPTDHEPTLAIMGIKLNHAKLEEQLQKLGKDIIMKSGRQ